MYDKKVHKKAAKLPDEIQLCNMEGVPLDDGVVELDEATKLNLAFLQLKWKLGLEKTLRRVLTAAIRKTEEEGFSK